MRKACGVKFDLKCPALGSCGAACPRALCFVVPRLRAVRALFEVRG